jgi:hypothetical protein
MAKAEKGTKYPRLAKASLQRDMGYQKKNPLPSFSLTFSVLRPGPAGLRPQQEMKIRRAKKVGFPASR